MIDSEKAHYCFGLPLLDRRGVSEPERNMLQLQLNRMRRRMGIGRAIEIFYLVSILVGGWIWLQQKPPQGTGLGLISLAYFGALFVYTGLFGAVVEVAVSRSGILRLFYALSLLGFVFYFMTMQIATGLVAIVETLTVACVSIVILGGTIALYFRWMEHRELQHRYPLAIQDISAGTVMRFGGTPDPELEYPNPLLKSGFDPIGPRQVLDVLPTSALVITVNEQPVTRWIPVELSELAAKGETMQAPLAEAVGADSEYFQRHLSKAEREELTQHSMQLLKQAIASGLATVWIIVFLFHTAQNIIEKRLSAELSPEGWAIAFLFGGFVISRHFYRRFLIEKDLESGHLLIARPLGRSREDGSLDTEVLARSGFFWTVNGQPATWRMEKWGW